MLLSLFLSAIYHFPLGSHACGQHSRRGAGFYLILVMILHVDIFNITPTEVFKNTLNECGLAFLVEIGTSVAWGDFAKSTHILRSPYGFGWQLVIEIKTITTEQRRLREIPHVQ